MSGLYWARRIGGLVAGWAAASVVIFLLVRVVPGDPARLLLKNPTPEKIAAIRERLGLDRSLPVQYVLFMKNVLGRGSFGESIVTGRDVKEDLRQMWPATLRLAVVAMVLATGAGVVLGVLGAQYAGRWPDLVASAISLVGVSVPVFWLGLVAIWVFVLRLGWATMTDNIWLPAAVLATIPMAFVARVTRAAVGEALQQDFVRTARAKGMAETMVVYRHALAAALPQVVSMSGMEFAQLLGGAVLTETVFGWPGMGRYVAGAVLARDYAAVQGALLVLVAMVMVVNLAVDLLHHLLDPRLRR
ncbi:MAG: ABC transporter permease [Verrucomicrobiae bacterium]|nr:ABC transporter permease [Verrucomicrobiae bacterium]